MTESLWNRYEISHKSPDVPVKRSPKVVGKERAFALNAPWNSAAMGFTSGIEFCCGSVVIIMIIIISLKFDVDIMLM